MARRPQLAPIVPIGGRAHVGDAGESCAAPSGEPKRFRLDGPPDILTVSEAAALLRLHRNRVYAMIRAGYLHAGRIDGMRKWLVSKAALERFLEQLDAKAQLELQDGNGVDAPNYTREALGWSGRSTGPPRRHTIPAR